jgi:hypothetical protein
LTCSCRLTVWFRCRARDHRLCFPRSFAIKAVLSVPSLLFSFISKSHNSKGLQFEDYLSIPSQLSSDNTTTTTTTPTQDILPYHHRHHHHQHAFHQTRLRRQGYLREVRLGSLPHNLHQSRLLQHLPERPRLRGIRDRPQASDQS